MRILTPKILQVTTVAGDGTEGHRDGTAAQAIFHYPSGLAVLPDGRVLVSQIHCIRVLSADLQEVTTVAGTGEQGHQDGAGVHARGGGRGGGGKETGRDETRALCGCGGGISLRRNALIMR